MRAFTIPPTAKVWVYDEPVNMNCSFPKLREIASPGALEKDIYLFANKKKNYLKVLYFAKNGWCIFAKQLPEGALKVPSGGKISIVDMHRIIDEISLKQIKQMKLAKTA